MFAAICCQHYQEPVIGITPPPPQGTDFSYVWNFMVTDKQDKKNG